MSARSTVAYRRAWARFAALVASAIVLLAAGAAAAGGWQVVEQPGRLHYRLPGSSAWQAAAPGLALPPGTSLRAGSGGSAVLGEGDDRITIRSGSELSLPEPGTQTVLQRLGSILYQIRPGAPRHFAVETPYLALGIKGTAFEVLVSPLGAQVQVSEGRVAAATPDRRSSVVLAPGQAARIGSAPGSLLEVQRAPGQAFAPGSEVSARPAGYHTDASREEPGIEAVGGANLATEDEVAPSIAPSEPESAVASSTPLGSMLEQLRSGVQGLLSHVQIVNDDRLLNQRRRSTLRAGRTLSGLVGGALGNDGGSGSGSSSGGGSSGSGSSGDSSDGGSSSSSSSGGSGTGGDGTSGNGSGSGSSTDSGSGGGLGGVGDAVGGLADGLGDTVGGVAGGLGEAVGGVTDSLGGLGSSLGL